MKIETFYNILKEFPHFRTDASDSPKQKTEVRNTKKTLRFILHWIN